VLALLLPASAPRAEDAKSIALGATIRDGALTLGPRTWTMPPGEWKLAGRHVREVRLNEMRGGVEVIEAFSAKVRDGRLEAGLILTAPTAGSRITTAWREDPSCRADKVLLKEDRSSATLSDCLVIRMLPALPAQVPGAGVGTPRPVLQILIIKYVASEYLRASSWFDPAVFGVKPGEAAALTAAPEAAVQWARAYRTVIDSALDSNGGTFQIPPLPAR
jgi:hypothetical protein